MARSAADSQAAVANNTNGAAASAAAPRGRGRGRGRRGGGQGGAPGRGGSAAAAATAGTVVQGRKRSRKSAGGDKEDMDASGPAPARRQQSIPVEGSQLTDLSTDEEGKEASPANPDAIPPPPRAPEASPARARVPAESAPTNLASRSRATSSVGKAARGASAGAGAGARTAPAPAPAARTAAPALPRLGSAAVARPALRTDPIAIDPSIASQGQRRADPGPPRAQRAHHHSQSRSQSQGQLQSQSDDNDLGPTGAQPRHVDSPKGPSANALNLMTAIGEYEAIGRGSDHAPARCKALAAILAATARSARLQAAGEVLQRLQTAEKELADAKEEITKLKAAVEAGKAGKKAAAGTGGFLHVELWRKMRVHVLTLLLPKEGRYANFKAVPVSSGARPDQLGTFVPHPKCADRQLYYVNWAAGAKGNEAMIDDLTKAGRYEARLNQKDWNLTDEAIAGPAIPKDTQAMFHSLLAAWRRNAKPTKAEAARAKLVADRRAGRLKTKLDTRREMNGRQRLLPSELIDAHLMLPDVSADKLEEGEEEPEPKSEAAEAERAAKAAEAELSDVKERNAARRARERLRASRRAAKSNTNIERQTPAYRARIITMAYRVLNRRWAQTNKKGGASCLKTFTLPEAERRREPLRWPMYRELVRRDWLDNLADNKEAEWLPLSEDMDIPDIVKAAKKLGVLHEMAEEAQSATPWLLQQENDEEYEASVLPPARCKESEGLGEWDPLAGASQFDFGLA